MSRYTNKYDMFIDTINKGGANVREDKRLDQARLDRLARDEQVQENWDTAQSESALRFEAGRTDQAARDTRNQENWQKDHDLSKITVNLAQTKERTAQELAGFRRSWLASGGDLAVASRILSAPLGTDNAAALSKDAQGQYIVTMTPGGSSVFAKNDQEYVVKMQDLLGNPGYATSVFNNRLKNQSSGIWVTDSEGLMRWVTQADSGKVKGTPAKGGTGKSGNVKATDLKALRDLFEKDALMGLVPHDDGTGGTFYTDQSGRAVPEAEVQKRKDQAGQDVWLAAAVMESTGVSITKAQRTINNLKEMFAKRQAGLASDANQEPGPAPGPGDPGQVPPAPAVIDPKTASELISLVQRVRSLHGGDFDEAGIKELIRAGHIDEARAKLISLTSQARRGPHPGRGRRLTLNDVYGNSSSVQAPPPRRFKVPDAVSTVPPPPL